MAPRIVHFYFFRFGHIYIEKFDILFSLLDWTRRTAVPVKRGKMPHRKPDAMRCVISSRNKPLHCYHGRYAHWLLWCLSLRRSNQTRELCRDQYPPAASMGMGWNETKRKPTTFTFTPGSKHLHVVSSPRFTQKTPIYLRNKPLNCYHGGYTYRLILCLLRRLLCGQQVGQNYIWKKKMAIPDLFVKQTPELLSQAYKHYVKVDIRKNKPLNSLFRLRLSCRLRYRYRPQTHIYPCITFK